MFGLKGFFSALARLTASINRSADLFDAANEHLAEQLGFNRPEPAPALDHQETGEAVKPERRRKATTK